MSVRKDESKFQNTAFLSEMAEWGAGCAQPPDFGIIEGAAGQRRHAALLLAHPDFQTFRHPCLLVDVQS